MSSPVCCSRLGRVDGPVHAAVTERWGASGVVELTGVIGYYTMVSMTSECTRNSNPSRREAAAVSAVAAVA